MLLRYNEDPRNKFIIQLEDSAPLRVFDKIKERYQIIRIIMSSEF